MGDIQHQVLPFLPQVSRALARSFLRDMPCVITAVLGVPHVLPRPHVRVSLLRPRWPHSPPQGVVRLTLSVSHRLWLFLPIIYFNLELLEFDYSQMHFGRSKKLSMKLVLGLSDLSSVIIIGEKRCISGL